MSPTTSLKTTPLYEIHNKLGAKIVSFAGWSMPIQYVGVTQEHLAVRERAGIFDVSHMGEIEVRGADAHRFLQYLLTNDLDKMEDGQVLYSMMCYDTGGVVDDLLVHRFSSDHYFLCVNAANTEKDFRWVTDHAADFEVAVENISDRTGQLAVQGPFAEALLRKVTEISLENIRYYHFKVGRIQEADCLISRTGYTGEDGFEIYCDSRKIVPVFEAILEAGREFGLQPAGLGARDTLRLEMGYPLYGHEIDQNTSPLEAGLGWVVRLNKKEAFIGQAPLEKAKKVGLQRKLAGVKLLDRGVPRAHYPVYHQDQLVGKVTSGTFSPSLSVGIALCYVPRGLAGVGTRLAIKIRDHMVPAEVVPLPFVPSHVKKG